jgi:hypothetical protein
MLQLMLISCHMNPGLTAAPASPVNHPYQIAENAHNYSGQTMQHYEGRAPQVRGLPSTHAAPASPVNRLLCATLRPS